MGRTYPACITQAQICAKCYTAQNKSCANKNSAYQSCSAHCDAANTKCEQCQCFCQLGVENINNHADVPKYNSPTCIIKDEIIMRNWTAAYWNNILKRMKTAARLGKVQNQGNLPHAGAPNVAADPCNNTHPQHSLITAEKYNQVADMMNFFRTSVPKVRKEDVIKGAHAKALDDASKNAKFNTNVCDVCNVKGQHAGTCNCACNCQCDCQCPCNCDCDCSCSCSCSCGCSSGGRS